MSLTLGFQMTNEIVHVRRIWKRDDEVAWVFQRKVRRDEGGFSFGFCFGGRMGDYFGY